MHNPKFDDFAIWNTLKCIQKKQFKYKNLKLKFDVGAL
jgi:hypothetical protein